MKPTQAQIETAIDLLVREKRVERILIDGKPGLRLVKNLVGLSQLETEMMEEIKQLKIENAALAAAAEVGEEKFEALRFAKNLKAATIERCAQVAENHPDKTITCNRIAAEIRALKEKP